jgi:hypothetical protein
VSVRVCSSSCKAGNISLQLLVWLSEAVMIVVAIPGLFLVRALFVVVSLWDSVVVLNFEGLALVKGNFCRRPSLVRPGSFELLGVNAKV